MASSSSTNSQPSSRVYQPRNQARRGWQQELAEWLWPTLWVSLLSGSGILALWALLWLTRIPPVPNCLELSRLSSAGDRLYCAKTQAKSASPTDLVTAIALTASWPKGSGYQESQEVLKDASGKLLFLASRRVQTGDLDGGVALASAIPQNTPLRQPAQAAIHEWRQEWTQAQALETSLASAIEARNWQAAAATLQQLKTLKSDFWLRDRYQHWQQLLYTEQRSWENLLAARALASPGQPLDLQQAIALARQVSLGSRVWQEAEQDIDRWSKTLLAYAVLQWQAGNLEAAVTAAQQVPASADWSPEAQVLIEFAHGQQLAALTAASGPGGTPTYRHLFYLAEAIRAVEKIPAESPLYEQAQVFLQDWQAQLKDVTQLKLAHSLAALGQGSAYSLAIAQAQTIEPDRPRRIQAQTLIAQWQNELERIADRPLLQRADQLARAGTIAALQQAIAAASEVQLGRALRLDAQSRIADWRSEIQTIEDRPIIDQAVALAEQGKLTAAIAAAQKVQPDRALYARADSLIKDWTRTLQIKEDQPILDEAKDLAYAGSLSAAISLASQIGSGRALYPEARRAIALWEAERNYIWSLEAEPESSDSQTDTGDGGDIYSDPAAAPE